MTVVVGKAHDNAAWLKRLRGLSGSSRDETWLGRAGDGVEFLRQNVVADDFVIYASLGHVYIQAVLAPLRELKKLQASDLAGTRLDVDDS